MAQVRRVGIGVARENAMLQIVFDSVKLPDGQMLPLTGHIIAVDDSRETVDADAKIHGIRATAGPSSVVSGFAISAAGMNPMLLLFGMSSSLGIFPIPESEIILPVGAELHFRLDQPLSISGAFRQAFRRYSIPRRTGTR